MIIPRGTSGGRKRYDGNGQHYLALTDQDPDTTLEELVDRETERKLIVGI